MCGLAGYSITQDATPPRDFLQNARATLKHRGPDDNGVYENHDHSLGLVHTRLSILDTSHLGHQPMISRDGSVALVFNGEIYNFRELRSQLEERGHVFHSETDTEVLLTLYLEQRNTLLSQSSLSSITTLLNSINGIFAFALWDNDCQSLLLARDSFGVKPMYFESSPAGVFFASELKVLARESSNVDFASLDRYLTFLWSPGDGTPSVDVHKLPPGEAMCSHRSHMRSRRPRGRPAGAPDVCPKS